MYFGSFPLHKAKWVQLNGKTLQVLKNSLPVGGLAIQKQIDYFEAHLKQKESDQTQYLFSTDVLLPLLSNIVHRGRFSISRKFCFLLIAFYGWSQNKVEQT